MGVRSKQVNQILIRMSKSEVLFHSFFRRAPHYWNFLPNDVTSLQAATFFATALKKISFLKFLKGAQLRTYIISPLCVYYFRIVFVYLFVFVN